MVLQVLHSQKAVAHSQGRLEVSRQVRSKVKGLPCFVSEA